MCNPIVSRKNIESFRDRPFSSGLMDEHMVEIRDDRLAYRHMYSTCKIIVRHKWLAGKLYVPTSSPMVKIESYANTVRAATTVTDISDRQNTRRDAPEHTL